MDIPCRKIDLDADHTRASESPDTYKLAATSAPSLGIHSEWLTDVINPVPRQSPRHGNIHDRPEDEEQEDGEDPAFHAVASGGRFHPHSGPRDSGGWPRLGTRMNQYTLATDRL